MAGIEELTELMNKKRGEKRESYSDTLRNLKSEKYRKSLSDKIFGSLSGLRVVITWEAHDLMINHGNACGRSAGVELYEDNE